jgi:hypothetical protein
LNYIVTTTRYASGRKAAPKEPLMIAGDIVRLRFTNVADLQLEVTMEEHAGHYMLRTEALRPKVYRDDFRTEVLDGAGRKVTEVGGRQKTLFSTVLDSFPTGLIRDDETGLDFAVENFGLAPGEAVYGFG